MSVTISTGGTSAGEYQCHGSLAWHYGVLPIRRVMASLPLLAGGKFQTVELLRLTCTQAPGKAFDAVVSSTKAVLVHQVLVDGHVIAFEPELGLNELAVGFAGRGT